MWENRQQMGPVKAFAETVKQSMFDPKRFYASLSPQSGYDQPLFYALICICLGALFTVFYQFAFRGFLSLVSLPFQTSSPADLSFGVGMAFLVAAVSLISAPIFGIIQIFLQTAIYHFCLWMLKAHFQGFNATFRAVAYAQGPQLLQIIPLLGPLAAGIWQLVILYHGFRRLQNATESQALFAILIPFLFCCVMSMILFFGVFALIMLIVLAAGQGT